MSNKYINLISNNTFIIIPILHMRKWRPWGNSSLAQCHTASKWQKYKYFQYVSVSPGKSLCISHLLRNGSAPKVSTYLLSTDRLYCWSSAPEAKETSYSLQALWPCCCLRAALLPSWPHVSFPDSGSDSPPFITVVSVCILVSHCYWNKPPNHGGFKRQTHALVVWKHGTPKQLALG